MRFKIITRSILYLLSIGLLLLMSNSVVQGARVAGEEGVTPVAPEPRKPAKRPAQVRPTVIKKPPRVQKKVLPKKKGHPGKEGPEKKGVR